ncbi:hypothetical protein EUX98_g8245 [Antrodiella citrinella]|uniref:CNH domain-containing protein n=1 Tax=Antrodiella citrinella TaxID=2447956 RepID=A0A4S4MBL7_9APHY|nr:hypothetical protein EUX98_g8245 [Antrodiella citrinella]
MAWSLLLVNSDPTHPVAFIVSRGAFVRSNESDIHKFMAYGVNEAHDKSPLSEPFKMLSQFPSSSHPRALHGSLLFFERNNETSDTAVVQARNVLTGDTMFMLRVPFSVADPVSMDDRVKIFLRLAVYDKYVIMFRTRRILLYRMPVDTGMGVCIDPIAAYQWQYRIDTVEYSIPRLRQSHPASRYPPPITLLVRFDSYYPWPVNLLHHFVIHPNPHFDPTVPTSTPYAPQPQPIAVIASPMRMFTPSDLILGPYGTAVWIDAQTDPDPTQAGDHGQRIAGRILASGNGEPVVDAETRLLQICETASKWGRLALDEEEGRIAVGHIDGRVTLFDYGRLEIVD